MPGCRYAQGWLCLSHMDAEARCSLHISGHRYGPLRAVPLNLAKSSSMYSFAALLPLCLRRESRFAPLDLHQTDATVIKSGK